MLELVWIRCPYCGEDFALGVDASAGDHDTVEDCQVCCKPIALSVRTSGDDITVRARTGDDA